MLKCVQCKDEDVKSNIINIGDYKVEVYNLDDNGWSLCSWCEFSLNERSDDV
tara:strand:+ start:198 stop:353 length:156 start_codon:yes stop_codon:yes gene_type:complete